MWVLALLTEICPRIAGKMTVPEGLRKIEIIAKTVVKLYMDPDSTITHKDAQRNRRWVCSV
jgi:hypothetical protein